MERKFEINLTSSIGEQIREKEVKNLTLGQRMNVLAKGENLFGYFSIGSHFETLYSEERGVPCYLKVTKPNPAKKNVSICEIYDGFINCFEIALVHFKGETMLIDYPAWQATYYGGRENLQISGIKFQALIDSLKKFIQERITDIPVEAQKISFSSFKKPANGLIMEDDEIFIKHFRPHTGYGSAVASDGQEILLDWNFITDIFLVKEGTVMKAELVELDKKTKFGITHTARIYTDTKVLHKESSHSVVRDFFTEKLKNILGNTESSNTNQTNYNLGDRW